MMEAEKARIIAKNSEKVQKLKEYLEKRIENEAQAGNLNLTYFYDMAFKSVMHVIIDWLKSYGYFAYLDRAMGDDCLIVTWDGNGQPEED